MNIPEDFRSLGLSEQMLEAVAGKGFEKPSPIQALVIPVLLARQNDIIAQAQTGTGKTAAFGLPLIEKLERGAGHVQALILVPTRELALQVTEELLSFNQTKKLSIAAIYGGASMSEQLRRLNKGIDIVVGTPGRILDHMRRGTLDLNGAGYLVLDEADEMLNMGFIEDIEEIMAGMNDSKRVMLFSATMPARIVALSRKYMHDVEILKAQANQLANDLTDQIYFEVRESDKFDALTRIIDVEPDFYGIVFSRTKIGVDEIVTRLLERGYAAEGLHGDVSQAQREKTLRKFRKKLVNILVATDVAARGIDIDNLTHVINYSLPQDPESYVHRIGRTGRAGNQGTAITFISNTELRQFGFMKKAIKADIKLETLPTAQDVVATKRARIKDELQQIVEDGNFEDCNAMAHEILENYDPEVALSALLKLAFKNELSETHYSEIRGFTVDRRGKTRIFIAVGRYDGYDPRKMVALLKRECGLPDSKIDDLRVLDSYSFVTVPFADAAGVVKKLNTLRKGNDRPLASVAKDRDGEPAGRQPDAEKAPRERKPARKSQDSFSADNVFEPKPARRKEPKKTPDDFLPDDIIEKKPARKTAAVKKAAADIASESAPRPIFERNDDGDWFSIFEQRFGKAESEDFAPAKKAKKGAVAAKPAKAGGKATRADKGRSPKPSPMERKQSRRNKREQKNRR